MIVTRTPLRLSIGGGGTDLPFYYREEGGCLITATLNKYIYCTVSQRFEEEIRVSYSENEVVSDFEDLDNDRAREVLRQNKVDKHLEVTTIADAPSGSGIGSSGAFTVGLIKALRRFNGLDKISDKKLAERAFDIEHNKLGYPCGKQDQYAASFGGIFQLKIDKNGETSVKPLDLDEKTINALESNIELFYTGQLRDSSEILEEQKEEMLSKDRKMKKMRRIKDIGKEIHQALEEGEPGKFGELLHKHWVAKKKFAEKMSNEKIDDAYEKALEEGAIGGKIMGAGGGGFFMFYVEENNERFIEKMKDYGLRHMSFKFDWDGTKAVYSDK